MIPFLALPPPLPISTQNIHGNLLPQAAAAAVTPSFFFPPLTLALPHTIFAFFPCLPLSSCTSNPPVADNPLAALSAVSRLWKLMNAQWDASTRTTDLMSEGER